MSEPLKVETFDGNVIYIGPVGKKGRRSSVTSPTIKLTGPTWESTGYSPIQFSTPVTTRKLKLATAE
jgi:hypothetical protein